MSEEEFWAIVDGARERGWEAEDPSEGRVEALTVLLCALRPEEIVAFDEHFRAKMDGAYRWDVWGAAYVLQGGCSDDGFTDFRSWLISLGRARYEATLRDPDSLAEVEFGPGKEQDGQLEAYAYAALRAYERTTSEPLPPARRSHPAKPAGREWAEEDLPKRFPRLSAAASGH